MVSKRMNEQEWIVEDMEERIYDLIRKRPGMTRDDLYILYTAYFSESDNKFKLSRVYFERLLGKLLINKRVNIDFSDASKKRYSVNVRL